jgi:hypothetical protein
MSSSPWGAPSSHSRQAGVADDIDYEIRGQALKFVALELDPGESAVAEAGARVWKDAGVEMTTMFGDGFWGMIIHNFAGPNLLILLAMLYDLVTRRRIHPVYLIATPLILAAELAASALYHSAFWPGLVRTLVGL